MSGNCLSHTEVGLFFRFCVVGTALVLHGCLQQPKPVISPSFSPSSPSQAILVTEALAEAEDLRTAMAAERIKAAKQTAKLRTAQNQVSALRNREIEHVATIANLEKELSTVATERNKLQDEVTQLRAQNASVPQLLEMVTQVRILETSLEGIVSSIDALAKETARLKGEVKKQQAMAARAQKSGAPGLAERAAHAEATDSIVVKRGDSLWGLAHRHATTVAELKTLNHLESDVIFVGQVLKIPPFARSLDRPDLDRSLNANNQPTAKARPHAPVSLPSRPN